jgi:hypothetical protein
VQHHGDCVSPCISLFVNHCYQKRWRTSQLNISEVMQASICQMFPRPIAGGLGSAFVRILQSSKTVLLPQPLEEIDGKGFLCGHHHWSVWTFGTAAVRQRESACSGCSALRAALQRLHLREVDVGGFRRSSLERLDVSGTGTAPSLQYV